MLPKAQLREADVATSLIIAALGAAVITGALRMPRSGSYGGMDITWYTSPAFFPLLLGGLLLFCSLGILARALGDGALPRLRGKLRTLPATLFHSKAALRILIIWVLLSTYIFCLAWHPFARLSVLFEPLAGSPLTVFLVEPEGTNYVVCSFVFLVSFMFVFYQPRQATRSGTTRLFLAAICLLVAWGVGYLFTQHLYSPLPG